MKIRELLFASIVLLSIFVVCIHGYCQNDDVVSGKTIDGNVVSVDSQKSQIVVKASELMTFLVPSDAKIVNSDGFGMQLSGVVAENYVTVDYHDDSSGNHIMDSMEVDYNR
jgi:hypothetical protein